MQRWVGLEGGVRWVTIGGRGCWGWGWLQIQWCEICMFMRNNIAFLLWKFCGIGVADATGAHNVSYTQRRRNISFFLTGNLNVVVAAVWQRCQWNFARFVMPTQRICRERKGEREMEIWCGYVNCNSNSASVLAAAAAALQLLQFCMQIALWPTQNWFNNKFNLSLSIFWYTYVSTQ